MADGIKARDGDERHQQVANADRQGHLDDNIQCLDEVFRESWDVGRGRGRVGKGRVGRVKVERGSVGSNKIARMTNLVRDCICTPLLLYPAAHLGDLIVAVRVRQRGGWVVVGMR